MTPKELVQEFIDRCDTATSGGTADPYALMSEDVDVKVQGRTFLAGDHPSREIVRRVLVDAVAEQIATANVEIVAMIGEGNRVAAQLRITGETHRGQIYNPKGELSGCIFGVDNERISQAILFLDNTMVETVLLGREYVSSTQA